MIKSKIDARERALEFAIGYINSKLTNKITSKDVVNIADRFATFLIGDANIPEVADDNAHIKELFEIANKSFDNSRKISGKVFDGNTGMAMGISGVPIQPDVE